jgi:dethiobiotin synthetase
MKGLFFTGTDTGVGKTTIAAAVAVLLRRQGRAVRVSKPVATGARLIDRRYVSDDTRALADAAGMPDALEEITPYCFPEPAAPPVAARLQGARLTLDSVTQAVVQQARPDAILLVEGIGGLLCPLTETETVADLARRLGLPLVIVARRSLGTLNHTSLTVEAARNHGLPVAGIVVNEMEPSHGIAAQTNVAELQCRIDSPVLAVVPFQGDPASALKTVPWERLAAQSH